jgi:hypothetical protein
MTLRSYLFPMIVGFCAIAAQATEPDWQTGLGRLFVTPQKRALLDELRRSNARMDPVQQLDTVRLDGIVRRSSGRQTIWINGHSYNDHAPVTRMDERSARVISGTKSGVELKVGESARLTPTSNAETRP